MRVGFTRAEAYSARGRAGLRVERARARCGVSPRVGDADGLRVFEKSFRGAIGCCSDEMVSLSLPEAAPMRGCDGERFEPSAHAAPP